jgi:tRNA threonylcarbamoyladenosine biosynthesis protein TsaB
VRLLALDCSGDRRSVALAADTAVAAARGETGARGHAERLVPLLEAVRAEAGWAWSSIDRLAVAVGPGSFTGVRLAVATARALALALDRPVLPVTTLAALATGAGECGAPVIPAIDARRGGLYVAWPDDDGRLSKPQVLAVAAAAERAPAAFVAVGSGAAALAAAAGRGRGRRFDVDARAVVAAALAATAEGAVAQPGPAVRPLYVRAADAVPRAA